MIFFSIGTARWRIEKVTLYKLGRFDHLSRSSYFTRISSILISTISRQNKAPRRMFNCDDCSGPMYQLASPVRTEWGREEENSPPPPPYA